MLPRLLLPRRHWQSPVLEPLQKATQIHPLRLRSEQFNLKRQVVPSLKLPRPLDAFFHELNPRNHLPSCEKYQFRHLRVKLRVLPQFLWQFQLHHSFNRGEDCMQPRPRVEP